MRVLLDKLRAEIASSEGRYLRPLAHLCRRFGVSYPTLLKAAHALRAQGLIEFQKGSRILISGRTVATPAQRDHATDRFVNLLLERIDCGYYRAGAELPKMRWLAAAEHVSTHTVSAAYRRLIQANIAHRSGRSVILGRSPDETMVCGSAGRVILILAGEDRGWRSICFDSSTEQFGHTFMGEASLREMRLGYACTVKPQFARSPMPYGRISLRRHIRQLGLSYQGTLIVGSLARIPDVADWIAELDRFGRPVVYFDRNDELDLPPASVRHLVRCRVREEAVAAVALDFLVRRGHRRIGFFAGPGPSGTTGWQKRRLDMLRTVASRDYAGTEIVELKEHDHSRWSTPALVHDDIARARDSGFLGVNDAVGRLIARRDQSLAVVQPEVPDRLVTGSPFDGIVADSYRRILLRHSEDQPVDADLLMVWKAMGLQELLRDRDVTVLVVANDRAARTVLESLEDFGVRIPQHVSILSFDNFFRHTAYPLTSVDFGLQQLGYKAFHAIADDIPIRLAKDRTITANPFVIDNGSVRDLTAGHR